MADHHAAQQTNGEADPGLGAGRGRISAAPEAFEVDLPDEAPRKRKSTGLMLVVLVIGVAIGALVAMRTLSGTPKPTKTEPVVDPDDVNRRLANMKGDIDDAMRDLNGDFTKKQNPDIANPFKSHQQPPPPPPPGPSKFERATEKLEVTIAMGGSNPMAKINGRFRHVGDVVSVDLGGADGTVGFKVKEITTESVTVVGEAADTPFSKTLAVRKR